jgi:hypothetical protein
MQSELGCTFTLCVAFCIFYAQSGFCVEAYSIWQVMGCNKKRLSTIDIKYQQLFIFMPSNRHKKYFSMDAIFKKLNYKGHKQVFALNAPASFDVNLQSIAGEATVKTKLGKADKVEFAIGFATKQTELDQIVNQVAPKLEGDAILWLCYPKGTSKKYKCDFNRDTGWAMAGQYDLEPVKQVAIDEDWSALRFRKVGFIKTMTRNEKMVLSEAGKKKAGKKLP